MSPALSTSAYDLKIEGIFYNILSLEDMTCEVTSDDVNHTRYEGDVVIPGTVTYNGRALTVLKIGEGAFDGNPITSVSIPATVQQVGSDAFDDCTRLTKVIIEDGDTQLLFAHSSYIDDLWHQERGIEMFKESPLETVYLGRPVIYPGLNGLTGVYYSTDSGPFNENKTLREVIIGNSVKELYDFTFGDCENLQTVTFGSSLEKIGKEAFARCKKLASVAFPNSVKVIGSGAFLSCSELVDMELGNSVDTIGSNAFLDCGFSEVRLPNSVRYIGGTSVWMSKSEGFLLWKFSGVHWRCRLSGVFCAYQCIHSKHCEGAGKRGVYEVFSSRKRQHRQLFSADRQVGIRRLHRSERRCYR